MFFRHDLSHAQALILLVNDMHKRAIFTAQEMLEAIFYIRAPYKYWIKYLKYTTTSEVRPFKNSGLLKPATNHSLSIMVGGYAPVL